MQTCLFSLLVLSCLSFELDEKAEQVRGYKTEEINSANLIQNVSSYIFRGILFDLTENIF